MKYWYWILYLCSLFSCQSLQLCHQTTTVLQKSLDSNYWVVERKTPSTIQLYSKKKFDLVVYYPEADTWAEIGERRQLAGFSYRTFEAPYRIELTFKPKNYNNKKHANKESHRSALLRKDNPKSTPFPRKKFVYQHTPIVLTTQFDGGGSIRGLEHLAAASQSSIQLDSLIYHINQYFGTPTELEDWSSKQVLTRMPSSYLDSIQAGKYYVDSTGGIIPNWGAFH